MAKATDKAVVEPTFVTPKALAEELNVDAKRIRAYLRGSEFARSLEAKNTSWLLDEATANAVRDRFTPSEDDGDDSDES